MMLPQESPFAGRERLDGLAERFAERPRIFRAEQLELGVVLRVGEARGQIVVEAVRT